MNTSASSLSRTNSGSLTAASTDTGAVLKYIIYNIAPMDLYNRISAKLKNPLPPSDAEAILRFFHIVGVSSSAAVTAVNDYQRRHCVRCHRMYYERDNGMFACQVMRMDIPRPANNVCRQEFIKFLGRHTTVSEVVQYDGVSIRRCGPACRDVNAAEILTTMSRGL